ncbi:MAG: SDR family oxidoreductase [Planctomycetota bacterium]
MSDSPENPTAVAIVTGASSGVGRDTATLLAEAGYAVALAARSADKLHETADFIREEVDPNAQLAVIPTDVADPDACQALIDKTVEAFGRLDALANVAGYAPLQPIPRIDAETLQKSTEVNLYSVVYTTRAAWPIFKQQKSGAICNVSSMAAFDPFQGFNIYAAAKAGINLFTKATADEGKRFNLRANAVAPGAIETPMLRENFSPKAIPEANTLDPLTVAGVIRDLLLGTTDTPNGETVQLPSPH